MSERQRRQVIREVSESDIIDTAQQASLSHSLSLSGLGVATLPVPIRNGLFLVSCVRLIGGGRALFQLGLLICDINGVDAHECENGAVVRVVPRPFVSPQFFAEIIN